MKCESYGKSRPQRYEIPFPLRAVTIRHERREAVREIASADSPWEARHEVRETHREISHERRERRREVRREVNKAYWDW